jgi:hypothetical protein
MKRTGRIALQLLVRTGTRPLRPLWSAAYRAVVTAAAVVLWPARATLYARGSLAREEVVPALSDIDLVAVVPDGRRRLAERLGRLIENRVIQLNIYEEDELADAMTTGLLVPSPTPAGAMRALLAGPSALERHLSLRTRPEPGGPTAGWRRMHGPERRPRIPPQDRRVVAWLELQCWWRYAAWAALHPSDRHVAHLCVKLVTEPLRAWHWLVCDELPLGRRDVLRRGLELLPEEEPLLRCTLELGAALHRAPPAPLEQTLAWLVRHSTRLAHAVDERAPRGEEVRLVRSAGAAPVLLDWRALVLPWDPPRPYVAGAGDPGRPEVLAGAARSEAAGRRVLLQAPALTLVPSADLTGRPLTRGTLRIVQCRPSDPITPALLAGEPVARFAAVPGWSARDMATRAVTEHRAALDAGAGAPVAAARAALWLRSLDGPDPCLAVDDDAVADALGEAPTLAVSRLLLA